MKYRKFFLTPLTAFIALLFSWVNAQASGRLVWSLEVNDSTATLIQNSFSAKNGTVFPFEQIPVKRQIKGQNIPIYDGSEMSSFTTQRAYLEVSEDGTLGGQNERSLVFTPDKALTSGEYTVKDEAVSSKSKRKVQILKSGRFSTIVVYESNGTEIFRTPQKVHGYSNISLDPQGNIITFTKIGNERGATAKTVAIDLENRLHVTLSLPDGTRYYSADGKWIAITWLKGLPGGEKMLILYDNQDPYNPQRVAEYNSLEPILTVSLCDDGSLIALQTLKAQNGVMGTENSVRILDRNLIEVEVLIPPEENNKDKGLQWSGKFLAVGFQYHPYPVLSESTKSVRIFDFTN